MPLSYPAKILLLGEHTILSGSKALAMPFPKFTGQWSYEDDQSKNREMSRQSLFAFLEHSLAEHIDHQRMRLDMERGLWFDSSIPQGFGVGSSGALIAAIYNTYSKPVGAMFEDKRNLARLENYFHGSSSGLDPLVSHMNAPLLIHSFSEVDVIKSPLNLQGFFLLNTGKPRQAGRLIAIYQEKMKDAQFKRGCSDVLTKDVDLAIEALITGASAHLSHHLWHISKLQWDFFPEMIPTQMRDFWVKGIESGDYVLKLCGAGGGGFMLGYSEKFRGKELSALFSDYEVIPL